MKKIFLLISLLILLIIPLVSSSVLHTLNAPANYYVSNSASVVFNWTPVSDVNTSLTSYLYLTNSTSESVFHLNDTVSCTNNTACNVTVTDFDDYYYKWYIVTEDDDGNSSSGSRWLQVASGTYDDWIILANNTLINASLVVKDNVSIGGGYGDTGLSLYDTGDLSMDGDLIVGGHLLNVSGINATGNIIPVTNNTYTIGNILKQWAEAWIVDLYATNLEQNLDGTGYNLTINTLYASYIDGFTALGNILLGNYNVTGVNELSSTLVDTTNLVADNLESNLDGTGFNVTVDELTATLVDTTNLEADNLESNIDATGYSITASTELASVTGDFDNLEATNLESNVDATGYSITASTELASVTGDFTNLEADNLESNLDGTGFNASMDILLVGNGTAALPSIGFIDDPDTGLYKSTTGTIDIINDGAARWTVTAGILGTNDGGRAAFRNVGPTATVPDILPAQDDPDTGIGHNAADELSFIAGAVEGLRIDANENEVQPLMTLAVGPIELEEDSGAVTVINLPVSATPSDGDEESMTFSIDSNAVLKVKGSADGSGGADDFQVVIGQTLGSAALPSLAFGDGNTGFFEDTDNQLYLSIAGIAKTRFLAGYMGGISATHPAFFWETPSATNPTITPRLDDGDTGIGHQGADNLSLIAGATEIMRLTNTTTPTVYIGDGAGGIGGYITSNTTCLRLWSPDGSTVTNICNV